MRAARKIINGLTILKAHLTGRAFPFYVNLILNNSCNMKCSYCYKNFYSRKTDEMSTEEAFRLIDELARAGTRQICVLGGEPLLRKDLPRIVDRIKDKKIVCGINTNGLLVGDNLDLIGKLDYVHISLDGNKRANDLNRGEGTYDRIYEALQLTAKNTKTAIGIACTLTKNNLGSIEDLAGIARNNRAEVSYFILMSQQNQSGGMETSALAPDWAEYKKAIDKITDLKKRGMPVRGSYAIFALTKKWPYETRKDALMGKPDFKWIRCYAGRFYCTIDADSKVYPCPRLIGEVKALSSSESGFKKAFQFTGESNPCRACNIMCYNELNYSFGMNPEVVLNYIRKRA